jgi:hypothetical protein
MALTFSVVSLILDNINISIALRGTVSPDWICHKVKSMNRVYNTINMRILTSQIK